MGTPCLKPPSYPLSADAKTKLDYFESTHAPPAGGSTVLLWKNAAGREEELIYAALWGPFFPLSVGVNLSERAVMNKKGMASAWQYMGGELFEFLDSLSGDGPREEPHSGLFLIPLFFFNDSRKFKNVRAAGFFYSF